MSRRLECQPQQNKTSFSTAVQKLCGTDLHPSAGILAAVTAYVRNPFVQIDVIAVVPLIVVHANVV